MENFVSKYSSSKKVSANHLHTSVIYILQNKVYVFYTLKKADFMNICNTYLTVTSTSTSFLILSFFSHFFDPVCNNWNLDVFLASMFLISYFCGCACFPEF